MNMISNHTMITGIVLLLLALVILGRVISLLSRSHFRFGINWMHVSSVDEDGNPIGKGEWVRIPEPDKIPENGLSHVVKYVARLVKSPSEHSSLIIASPDGNKACLIIGNKGQLKILEGIHLEPSSRVVKGPFRKWNIPPDSPEPEKEQAVRKLFEELNIAPEVDRVHDYNGYADAMRDLHYPIGNEVSQATRIIQRVLREIYQVQ